MKRMNARYAGTCGECKQRFPKGAKIDFDRDAPKGLKTFHADCNAGADKEEDSAPGHGPGCYGECDGLYDCFDSYAPAPQDRRIIEITTASGTFYQRSGGRCEDAPCCGCCTF